MILQPNKKSTKKLREVLNAVFKHLDEVAAASIMDVSVHFNGKCHVLPMTGINLDTVNFLKPEEYMVSIQNVPCFFQFLLSLKTAIVLYRKQKEK